MAQYLLGIDNGNTICKATLFHASGRVVHSIANKVAANYSRAGWSERNLDKLWKTNAATIRNLILECGINASEIAGIGGTGHGNGLYLLDKEGRSLRGIQSLDSRAGGIVEKWKVEGLASKVSPLTQQEFWASQSNTLLAWLKRFDPETYENIGSVLLCKDYINYRLTERISTDYTDISATNLLNIHTRQYDDLLLDYYDLGDIRHALPPILHSHEIMGKVSPIAASETGLATDTPVVAGMLDADASLIGGGTIADGQVGIVAGTWSVNGLVSCHPPNDPELAMTALFAVPNHYLAIEASATSMTNLEWFISKFCGEECREAERRQISKYQICEELAGKVLASSPLIFHPFLHGSNFQANARAGFFGLAEWHDKADMLRAIYEGIVFGHRTHMDKLNSEGSRIPILRLSGGGSRSPLLGQLFADILETKIEVPGTEETGTWGAAMAAGVGTGLFTSYEEAVESTVDLSAAYQPNIEVIPYYRKKYQLYCRLTESMKPIWKELSSLNQP